MKLLVLLAALVATQSHGQVWIKVGDADDGGQLFVDATSIRRQGQFMKAWTRYVTTANLKLSYPQVEYKVSQSLTYFDCKSETYAQKQAVFYEAEAASSKIVHSFSNPDSRLSFDDPIPGSLGQSVLRRVCSHQRQ